MNYSLEIQPIEADQFERLSSMKSGSNWNVSFVAFGFFDFYFDLLHSSKIKWK